MKPVHIIGAGLAGSEAAWQLSKYGIPVVLHEMRGVKSTPAHSTDKFAELVCSNSFRSDDINNAVGLLHEEMRKLDSLIMKCADQCKVPAGSALAVDREAFAEMVQATLLSRNNIEVRREEVTEIPNDQVVIIASGPLTSDKLSEQIKNITEGEGYLYFFDAIAPIVYKESIDFSKAWFQSRYDKGDGKDYINCPLSREQYYSFIEDLREGEKTEFKEWEKDTPYFNGCLPIEVMAERGKETLRFGPMKPVGLTNPNSEEKPYAVVQLRQDNKLGTLYNIVGFQTKLKWGAQKEVFKKIPGLENAEFARLGGLHRNTFINSPKLLDTKLRLKANHKIRFAGQITGVEGYLESAAIGLAVGLFTYFELNNLAIPEIPRDTALGALIGHITQNAESDTFQPMNVNFGLFPPLTERVADRKAEYSRRAVNSLAEWIKILS
ncbi:methylenetetrahydrofolate-tRNA-(uracil-5-)-methyltransferase [endosymbiont of Acanthamoeba sp. UWC8]|uniref:methylenetetrahydrofolate--tRNA-(uracil(54)- C(5))-methyltransferase (FADH(2)-oxidizing) TrmFO n=1 Tax=endosymbiont of Acanthamoeba sp. UWC8 TaxID=86106 RepID=UPI0004D1D2E3|nr:methylenetetrahydrofolate--tRNA-(uracil(54)-C(5))-methyltransferase (FADH(2)-oxidizing) TrmFO [endosymbiont of Acanthamoeba sp. UWC8]AIF81856.1 methylenetetrahydrofolate-tRNA-(uracil-5-)-methyltransferase [endosymbiont of Acanthamoeba sp. UWC8]